MVGEARYSREFHVEFDVLFKKMDDAKSCKEAVSVLSDVLETFGFLRAKYLFWPIKLSDKPEKLRFFELENANPRPREKWTSEDAIALNIWRDQQCGSTNRQVYEGGAESIVFLGPARGTISFSCIVAEVNGGLRRSVSTAHKNYEECAEIVTLLLSILHYRVSKRDLLVDAPDVTLKINDYIKYLVVGIQPAGIAERLGVSIDVVYRNLSEVQERLAARTRAEMIAACIALNLIE